MISTRCRQRKCNSRILRKLTLHGRATHLRVCNRAGILVVPAWGTKRRKTDMAMLHRFTLKRNKSEGGWELKDQTGGR